MLIYYSYIFLIVYFLSITSGVFIYFHYLYYTERKRRESNLNVKNVIQVSKDHILTTKKAPTNDTPINKFPPELYQYIVKPTPESITSLLLQYAGAARTEAIDDMHRCISIASCLYNREIPLVFFKVDRRTTRLYNLIAEELALRHIVVINFFLERLKDTIENFREEYDDHIRRYMPELFIVGEELIRCNEDTSFPSLECFTDIVNRTRGKHFTESEIKALATVFSVVTSIKIPKMYIEIDTITLSLVHFRSPSKSNVVNV